MNKYRLNQILEILLFPVVDSALSEKDPLLTYYLNYIQYMDQLQACTANASHNLSGVNAAKKELINYLVRRNAGNVNSEDEVWMLMELYYPMNRLQKEMQEIDRYCHTAGRKGSAKEKICICYLNSLSKIAHSLITYRDGRAAIRYWAEHGEDTENQLIFDKESVYNKVEIWNLLCRFTAPDIYIVIAAVDKNLGLEALYEQKAGIVLADKLLTQAMQKGVAENHIHFNVGFDYEILWLRRMDLCFVNHVSIIKWTRAESIRLSMCLFRYMAAVYLNEGENTDFSVWMWMKAKDTAAYTMVKQLYDGQYPDKLGADEYHNILRMCQPLEENYSPKAYDYLMNRVYSEYLEYKVSSEFILLYQCYTYLRGRGRADTSFARLFIQYLRNKNEYYYSMYEQCTLQGLKFFQKKYRQTKSMAESVMDRTDLMVEIFRSQAKVRNLKKLEIRIAPAVSETDLNPLEYKSVRRRLLPQLYDQIYGILSAYKRYILESTLGVKETWNIIHCEEKEKLSESEQKYIIDEIKKKNPAIPTLGIVFHFLKSEYYEDMSGYECWKNVIQRPGKHTRYKLMRRYFMSDVAMAIEEIRSAVPKLSEYIVGIDAASDENATEPWMFSMVYKNMRSSEVVKPVVKRQRNPNGFEYIQNIGFTYHVGEDFRHLISGLRHVDEVIEEFGYRTGDRLGHALALGIDIDKWVDRNEVVTLPRLEYLENMLWMWGINTCEGIGLPIQPEVLEDRIISMAKSIYKRSESITVKMLYTAYKMKFDADHRKICERVEKYSNRDTHIFCRYDQCEKECYETWNSERLLLTNYCPVFEERYSKKELVEVDKRDVPLFRKLQEYLIDKVEKAGIYIETNPTSNLSIGELEYMDKHPIFSLNQINGQSGHRVLVTINSDDPAVFNTNVENEFAYIYYAAEKQGISKAAILEWIDKVRQYGMEASFVQTIKSAEQIYIDTDTILKAIEHIMHRR